MAAPTRQGAGERQARSHSREIAAGRDGAHRRPKGGADHGQGEGQETADTAEAEKVIDSHSNPRSQSSGRGFHYQHTGGAMYLFAQHGILSIVAHNKKPDMLMVRSVARRDIEHYWPSAKIVRTDDGDYRFRTRLPRDEVAARIA